VNPCSGLVYYTHYDLDALSVGINRNELCYVTKNERDVPLTNDCNGRINQSAVQQLSPDIQFLRSEELSLLGSPLHPDAAATAIEKKTSAIRLLTSRLGELQAHQALFILKNCPWTPKVLYVLRSSPAWMRTDNLMEFDDMLRVSLANISNTDMSDVVRRQATLPVSRGGLGIRRTRSSSLSGFGSLCVYPDIQDRS
jgi:hypothetical protein